MGRFYECYIAYLLGGTKTFNPNAQCPDVQLPSADGILEKHLLFEVKAGHRTNGIVLKKNQLDIFETLMNCYYAVVFHQSKDIQARWSEGRKSQQAIRKELENPSSIFIVPPQLMLEFYIAHLKSAQPLPRC